MLIVRVIISIQIYMSEYRRTIELNHIDYINTSSIVMIIVAICYIYKLVLLKIDIYFINR